MLTLEERNNILEACKTLGVKPSSTIDEIKQAYRHQAKLNHPDKNKNPSAEEQFKKISNAYELLSNATNRKMLDQFPIEDKLLNTSNTTASEQPTSSSSHSFFNQSNWFNPEPAPTNTKQDSQSDWKFDNFSTEQDTFRFKGVSGDFNGDHVTFFQYATSNPCISFTFKNHQDFYHKIFAEIRNTLYYDLWVTLVTNSVEGALKFTLPRDKNCYEKILSIIFDEYQLPKSYRDIITNKKLKFEFMPKQEQNFKYKQ